MDWIYSEKVKEHFRHPKNILEDETKYKADGKGYVGNPVCGDMMFMAIKVNKKNNTISDCKWKTYGCASALASTSALSEMVRGMKLEDAYKIKPQDIVKELGGLPTHKIHCSVLGDKALRAAIDDYKKSSKSQLPSSKKFVQKRDDRIICDCLQVSVGDIEEAVKAGVKTFEALQARTKIGTSCGECGVEAKEVLKEYLKKYSK